VSRALSASRQRAGSGAGAGSGKRTTWMRGAALQDATAVSALGRGANSSSRVFPPSNKVPTPCLLMTSPAPTTLLSRTRMPGGASIFNHFAEESVGRDGLDRTISAAQPARYHRDRTNSG